MVRTFQTRSSVTMIVNLVRPSFLGWPFLFQNREILMSLLASHLSVLHSEETTPNQESRWQLVP